MRRRPSVTPRRLAALFFVGLPAVAWGTSWTSLGPGGAFVRRVVVDATDSQRVFVATRDAGVLVSADRGETWTWVNTGLIGRDASALAIDPTAPDTLYAGVGYTAFKTTNGGQSWSNLRQAPFDTYGGRVTDLIVDPVQPQHVFVSTDAGAVIQSSTDGGQTWSLLTAVHNAIGDPESVSALALDASAPSRLYFASLHQIGRVNDLGQIDRVRFDYGPIGRLVAHPTDPDILYYAAAAGYGPSGSTGSVFRTDDAGVGWNPVLDTMGAITALTIDRGAPDTLYVGQIDGTVLRTTTGGAGWSPIPAAGTPGMEVTDVAVDPGDSGTLYVAQRTGLRRTAADGSAQSDLSPGLAGLRVNDIALDRQDAATIWVATSGGVYRSTNGGQTWGVAFAGQQASSILLDPGTGQTAYVGLGTIAPYERRLEPGALMKTIDGGGSWSDVSPPERVYGARVLAIDPSDTQVVWAAVQNVTGDLSYDRSSTGGTAWAPAPGVPANPWVFDPRDPSVAYAPGSTILKTTDHGATWAAANGGVIPGSAGVWAVALDPRNPDVVYAGLSTGGVWKSTDRAASWRDVGLGLPSAAVLTLAVSQTGGVYAGTDGRGVWESPDGEGGWRPAGTFPSSPDVRALALDPHDDGRRFAGVSGGLFVTAGAVACGDGFTSGGEGCDLGPANGTPGACCDASCQPVTTGACRLAPPCGNGQLDPGESCDDGAAAGTETSCCSDRCQRVADGDADGLCDNVDPCTNPAAVTVRRPRLRLRGLGGPSGSARLRFEGVLVLPRTPRLVLPRTGARIRIASVFEPLLDVTIPPGKGWRRTGSSTRWRGRGADGVRTFVAEDLGGDPRRVRFSMVRRGALTLPTDTPLLATVVIEGATGRNNLCGEWQFDVGRTSPCSSSGTSVSCR
ncbi:MAG: hypothetical protein U0807_01285 [Candidatus Binatia bacterium]